MSNYGRSVPSNQTSCWCSCGCFLISIESCCPICGSSNPCYGNESDAEREARYEDFDDADEDDL